MRKRVVILAAAFLVVAVIAALLIANPQLLCRHEFEITESIPATCFDAGKLRQNCSKCGRETEEILPKLEHVWLDATCQSPKTCQLCGTAEGESGGHTWLDATCENPKTCAVCALTEGTALSPDKTHTWMDATCESPKTCSVCAIAEGDPLPHTPGQWKILDYGTGDEQGVRQQKCTACGAVLVTEKFDPASKVAGEIVEDLVASYGGHANVEVIAAGGEDNRVVVTGAIYCENSEQMVEDILAALVKSLQEASIEAECSFAIGDIEEGKEGERLATASIDFDGNYSIFTTSIHFKSARNAWILGQFSTEDGSHTDLKAIILESLEDKASFVHKETKYIDVATEDTMTQINNILYQSGYFKSVAVGDLYVTTAFSAADASGAVADHSASAIISYSTKEVILLGID